MRLVTLQQARDHLRSDTDADDTDLELKIEAASSLVVDYLKEYADSFLDSAGDVFVDSAGDPVGVPRKVQSATLVMIGYLYRERDGSNEFAVPAQWGYGFLPLGVTALLYNLRRPTVA